MRPRRVPFARDYIGETVDAFIVANSRGDDMDPIEMEWAQDVLAEYFIVHADCEEVTSFRSLFEMGCAERLKRSIPSKIPYKRNLVSPPPVTIKEMAELAKRRRSVRWFLQKPVERELIDEDLKIGAQAPRACNRQPFEFRIFDDSELVQKIISIPYGLVGYGHNVPVVVVVIGQQRHFFSERDRHLVYIDSSLAVMGFLFALEAQGLSSCCVNWPDIEVNEKKIADLLKLQYDERPIMLIAIGYPDPEGLVANSSKKSLSYLRRYNFE